MHSPKMGAYHQLQVRHDFLRHASAEHFLPHIAQLRFDSANEAMIGI